MNRRSLFRGLLAAPALVVAAPPPAAKASEDEKTAALKMIDDWAEGHFGAVKDGIARAWQTHLLYKKGREPKRNEWGFGEVENSVTRVNQMFIMDGYDRPGVPDALAKAVIAWVDSTLDGRLMHKSECPESRLYWRVRPNFRITGPDFERNYPGGHLRIRTRAHTWNGYPDIRGTA